MALDLSLREELYPTTALGEIDGKLYASNSEIATFRECPLKWWLAYANRLRPAVKDVRLDTGTLWHRVLEVYDGELGQTALLDKATEAALRELSDLSEQFDHLEADVFDRLRWMFDDYVRLYGQADLDGWIPLQLEHRFEFPMPVPGANNLHYTGKVDALKAVYGHDEIWIWDNKTASKRDVSKDGFTNEMLLYDQFPLYVAARRRLGLSCQGLVINLARTDRLKRAMLDEERFHRIPQTYGQTALDQIWRDFETTATAMIACRDDPGRIYSVPQPDRCKWKCGFFGVHLEARHTGRDPVEVALGYGFVQGDDSALPVELADESW